MYFRKKITDNTIKGKFSEGMEKAFWNQDTWVLISALPIMDRITLGKSLCFSELP